MARRSVFSGVLLFLIMLGLQLPTDPRWASAAEMHLSDILTDHAYCEQKAASTAISLMITYPELSDLVTEMSALAREEMSHFEMVHKRILERGMTLGRERKDEYVAAITKFFAPHGDRMKRLVHRLLIAALIEARSCERFRVLSESVQDAELATFYSRLMASEANHYTIFLKFARQYGERAQVDRLWKGLLAYEATVVVTFTNPQYVHG
jgi:tRNA 2-(methylsulfanyl)-N6-isopentenyladenosine37 hydroxylase